MKRFFSALVILGALALATSPVTQASQRAARHATPASVNADCAAACSVPDGSACPNGCPLCCSQQGEAAVAAGSVGH